MLKRSSWLLLAALIFGIFGFNGMSGAVADVARLLFFLCVASFLITFVFAAYAGRSLL
jgi:uncharacterized membrane protein YtjA (UPF0391 family)